MVEALGEAGVSHHEVLARAGLPSRLLDVPGLRVSLAEYFALWRAIAAVSANPDIGMALARLVKPDVTEPIVLAVLSAVDVAGALDVAARYKRSLCPEDLTIQLPPVDFMLSSADERQIPIDLIADRHADPVEVTREGLMSDAQRAGRSSQPAPLVVREQPRGRHARAARRSAPATGSPPTHPAPAAPARRPRSPSAARPAR